ncbi:MAG: hypothetical protein FJ197_07850 [Gammaproteobacteria bacterium]|nr:hypothetical protein [Gammaproteobacteria bacterium]
MTRALRIAAACLALAAVLSAGCSSSRKIQYEKVDLERASAEVPPGELLDVGIMLFDPGLPEGEPDPDSLVFPDVRRAESRYMPYHLRGTLESSGHWGSVWVLPDRSASVDLLVWARIDHSDGLEVALRVGAWDATGKEWLNKAYRTRVAEKAYSRYRDPGLDPYQNVYNEIANDLLALRQKLGERDLARLREIAELRFADDLAPAAFDGFLARDEKGIYSVQRLPAEDDPMLSRLRAVREREYALVDTLNEYYAALYFDIGKPYEDWRKVSRTETLKYEDLKRSAMLRYLLGGAALLGAILYEGNSSSSNSAITTTGVIGGIEGIKAGLAKQREATLAREGIKEQGKSLEAEAEPLLVEIEGQTKRLSGTAEEKFREWRRLLREVYERETGLPAAVSAPATPAPAG